MAKNKEAEVAVILPEEPNELIVLAEKSGIEITEAQSIGISFLPLMNKVDEITAQIDLLEANNPTKEDVKKANRLRLDLVANRGINGLKGVKEKAKSNLLLRTRLIDSYHNLIEDSSKLAENKAEAIENHYVRLEELRLDAIVSERTALLTPYGEINKFVNIREMDDQSFSEFMESSKIAFEARNAAAIKAEQDRIEAEAKAESDRIAQELADKAERERIEKENAELKAEQERLAGIAKLEEERLSAEKTLLSARAKILSDAGFKFDGETFWAVEVAVLNSQLAEQSEKEFDLLVKSGTKEIDSENKAIEKAKLAKEKSDAIEKEKSDKIAADLKIENDRIAAENKVLQDAEAERKAEADRLEAERIAKEKAAALAPDKDKVRVFFDAFEALVIPELTTPEGKAIMVNIREAMKLTRGAIIIEARKLV